MLPEVDALPRAQAQPTLAHGHLQAAGREDCAYVGGHVVGPLAVVSKQRVAVRYQACQEPLDVAMHVRIGVLGNQQGAAGVMAEHVQHAHLHAAGGNEVVQLWGEVV